MALIIVVPGTLNFAIVLALMASCGLVHAETDPAALIPVVSIESIINSSSTLDPANWSPSTPQPVLNTTEKRTEHDDCLESNGTRVQVHNVDKSFCVHGWPICNTKNQQGLCPDAQQGLPNGAWCSLLPSHTSMYGCLQKVAQTVPTSCRLRSSKT